MVRNEEQETFFTYGYDAEHASILYCYSRQCMSNFFRGTAFNTHKLQNVSEVKEGMSDIFFYLPSITDRKESVNRYRNQVSLVPVTCTANDISKFSPQGYAFNPAHLDLDPETEDNARAREMLIEFFLNAARFSNSNLTQNVYALIKEKNIDQSSLQWAPSMAQSKVDMGRFSRASRDQCLFLPDELWYFIISFLSYVDRIQLGRTSKKFHLLANDSVFWGTAKKHLSGVFIIPVENNFGKEFCTMFENFF